MKLCRLLPVVTESNFSSYVLPLPAIPPEATSVTGLSVANIGGKRHLVKNPETIPNVKSLEEACVQFVSWLSDIGPPVLLVAHN